MMNEIAERALLAYRDAQRFVAVEPVTVEVTEESLRLATMREPERGVVGGYDPAKRTYLAGAALTPTEQLRAVFQQDLERRRIEDGVQAFTPEQLAWLTGQRWQFHILQICHRLMGGTGRPGRDPATRQFAKQ